MARRYLEKEAIAAKALRESLHSDDQELVAGMVEGETEFFECLSSVLESMDNDEILLQGIMHRQQDLDLRYQRIAERRQQKRAAIEAAMMVSELPKCETPLGTVSLKAVAQQLQITDESRIPAKYFTRGKPRLDRKTLLKDLKNLAADESIPGADLDNGGQTIQIRMK